MQHRFQSHPIMKKIGITTIGDKGYIAINNAAKMKVFALISYLENQGLMNN